MPPLDLSQSFPVRRQLCAALATLALAVGGLSPAHADTYPERNVVMLVPFAPGGTVDNVARHVQQRLAQELGQTVVIENRGGAGGTIGMAAVAKAKPDGYMMGMVFDSFATEQHIYPKLSYGVEDLTGVAYMVRSPMVLAVAPSTPYQTLDQYVAAAKTGDVSFASVGAGSSNHLAAELFHQTAASRGIHTPYKGGGPAITDLMGGHVDSIIASLPLVLPHIQSGKLRALAVTAPQRVPALPDVPAMSETYPGFEIYSWVGMVAPAGVPAERLDRMSAAVQAALRDPDVTQRVTQAGFEVVAEGRDAMNTLVKTESARWGRLIDDIKLRPE